MSISAEIPRNAAPLPSSVELRGPADADHFRVKVGRYGDRWYTDPTPTCPVAEASDWQGPSYSIVEGASGKDWSFVSLGRGADAIAANPRDFDCDRGTIYDRLTSANKRGLKQAAGRGTIIHLWFEDGLAGRPFRVITDDMLQWLRLPAASRDEALRYLPAIAAFFDAYQPELVVAEIVCIDRDLNGIGYGCTGDAGIRIEGDLFAADWKSRGDSSDHGAYPKEGAQVGGAFASARYGIVAGDTGPVRIPIPKFAGGLIVSVKSDGCRLYPVDIGKARTHFEAMHAWWVARRDERKPIGRPWPPKAPAVEPAAAPTSPKVVEQPEGSSKPSGPDGAGGVATPAPSDDVKEQYFALDAAQRAEVIRLRDEHIAGELRFGRVVSKRDATALAIGWVRPFDIELPPQPAAPPTHLLERAVRFTGDEGPAIDGLEALQARGWMGALSETHPDGYAQVRQVGKQANDAGVSFHIVAKPTRRRYEIYRGLAALARYGWVDELARCLLADATGDDACRQPAVPLGQIVGLLDNTQAADFADLACRLERGTVQPVVLDDGHFGFAAADAEATP